MLYIMVFFCFKQKTAYEMRISDWSSDVCSSDLTSLCRNTCFSHPELRMPAIMDAWFNSSEKMMQPGSIFDNVESVASLDTYPLVKSSAPSLPCKSASSASRSEEHTSELQSLMRISYAVFCLKKKKKTPTANQQNTKFN